MPNLEKVLILKQKRGSKKNIAGWKNQWSRLGTWNTFKYKSIQAKTFLTDWIRVVVRFTCFYSWEWGSDGKIKGGVEERGEGGGGCEWSVCASYITTEPSLSRKWPLWKFTLKGYNYFLCYQLNLDLFQFICISSR